MARKILEESEVSINYLYVQELDQLGHIKGWESTEWRNLLEQLNSLVEKLVRDLPKDVGVVVTSDHGMLDTSDAKRVELDSVLDGLEVEFVGGDTRSMYLYFKDEQEAELALIQLERFSQFTAHSVAQLVEAGIYGEIGPQARERLPHAVLLAKGSNTLYHSGFSKPRSYRMVAHHGGLSAQELQIPLIRFNI